MVEAATKTFDARVIGGLTTGIMLMDGGFSSMHEAAEHVLGHPIWTHEFADHALCDRVRDKIVETLPDFPVEKPDDWRAFADQLLATYPDGVALPLGSDARSEDPIASAHRILGDR